MNSNIFIINNVKGKYCYICNSINLNWENNVQKIFNNENLDLNKFINKYNTYLCNAALCFKKSNIILYIDSINILNYLEIKIKNTYDKQTLKYIFNDHPIYNDDIEIRLNFNNINIKKNNSIKNNNIDNCISHPYTKYNYYYSSSHNDKNSLDNNCNNSCDTKKDNICNHSCNNKIYNICNNSNNLRCPTCDC